MSDDSLDSSFPFPSLSRWDGAADPAYLLEEIVELRNIAEQGGLGTLADLLQWAADECTRQVNLRTEKLRG